MDALTDILMSEEVIRLGVGIYSRADAARLLGISAQRLRRWVGGYTYWLRSATNTTRRARPALIQSDLPIVDDTLALSFVELMELRVVVRLLDLGVPLQRIRTAAGIAAKEFATQHPFASERVFTDGRQVFAAVSGEAVAPDIVELPRRKHTQLVSGRVFEPFLQELDFDKHTALAERWWPLGKGIPVVLDPRVAFGAPIVAGTSIRTRTIGSLAAESPAEEIARAYHISRAQVRAAARFEKQIRAA
ncbi:MAG: DUF433 domain-containing protein [Steroidobacteraceae bacterium]